MKRKNIIIATLALGLAATTLMAQDDQRPRRGGPGPDDQPREGARFHHRMVPPPLVVTLDANHDGTLSADEIANASAALKNLDKNGDGQLTREELLPPPPERPERPGRPESSGPDGERRGPRPDGDRKGPPPGGDFHKFHREGAGHPPVPPMINALDANHDKTISADEIANASNALKTLDKNGDGQLTMEELRPERRPPPNDN
jgi:hypothetical protein